MRTLRNTALAALLAAVAVPASAQTLQQEMARDIRAVGEKMVGLAEAMP